MRNRTDRVAHPRLLKWCGLGSILSGVLFVAWGYIDRPNISESLTAATHVLALAVPALFLMAVAGVAGLRGNRFGALGWTGMVLVVYGLGWGVVAAVVGGESMWLYFAGRGWLHYLSNWLPFIFAGLMLIGIATGRRKSLRGLGALVFTMGVFGWVYYLTDSGAVLEARLVHIGFGLLFSLGWVALGLKLWLTATKQATESHT